MDERRCSSILHLGMHGGEWSALHPGLFNSGAEVPGTERTGGYMSPKRASLNASERENSVVPTGNLKTSNASSSVVESRYTDWTTPVPSYDSYKI